MTAIKKASKKTGKKNPAKKASSTEFSSKRSGGDGQACWPGFKHAAGTKAGTKGSCVPKAKQTGAEKEADSRAAAATKLP